ncbi:MAG TPA: hypothetical protein VH396_18255 [Chitinophagaceae bacterium]
MLTVILNWMEVWAPLIPLYVFIVKRPDEKHLEIIAAYLLTSLCINLIIDVSWLFNSCMPPALKNNNFLYNIISVCRVFFFVIFFMNTTSLLSKKVYNLFLGLYVLLFAIYFTFFADFFTLSSMLHSIEALGLLALCILYFTRLIKSDEVFFGFDPYLIIISGLAIYESVNFFVFLFYSYLMENSGQDFAKVLWRVPNIIFLVFCLFITRAFYERHNQ